MKLIGKQKRFLRAKANHMTPKFSIGKNGLNKVWLDEVSKVVENRELVKINIQQSSDATTSDVKQFIEGNSEIQVVQTIGRTLLLFKPAEEEKNQKISEEVFHL